MVRGFLGEDGGELSEFGRKGGFWFVPFGFHGKFGGGGEFGDDRRSLGERAGFSVDGLEKGAVVKSTGEELFLVLLFKEAIKVVVVDGGYMDVLRCREVGVVAFRVFGTGGVEVV